MRSAYLSAGENFGYQAFASEHLDPASPPDLKETFTMRNILNATIEEHRWPSNEFKELMQLFYTECLERAFLLQRILAKALNLDENFFVKFHSRRLRRRHNIGISKRSCVVLTAHLCSCAVQSLRIACTSFEITFGHYMFSLISLRTHKPT